MAAPAGSERARTGGEFFVRDSGGSGQPALLVHDWMFPSHLARGRPYRCTVAVKEVQVSPTEHV